MTKPPTSEAQKRMFALMERYNQLGRQLPNDLDTDDADAVASAKVILAEMKKTMAAIDAMMLACVTG